MTRPPMLRLFRIITSVVCVLCCGLLFALWVRSYQWADLVRGPVFGTTYAFSNDEGWLTLRWFRPRVPDTRWKVTREAIELRDIEVQEFIATGGIYTAMARQFGLSKNRFQLPHWFPFVLFAALAGVPWLQWRFSLRTLLLATTLLAVALGLAVAMK